MTPVIADSSNDYLQADKSGGKKRKFRADPPGDDPDNSSSATDDDYLSLGLSFCTDDVANDVVNWSLPTASEVHNLATRIFETMLRDAIKKIVASGYSEELANKAVLKHCTYYGLEDAVSTVIDNTLLFLKDANEFDLSRAHYFDDLEKMAEHVVWALACILRRFRPFLSIGDAYWLLILGDMTVQNACSLIDSLSGETPDSTQTYEFAIPDESIVCQISSMNEIKSEKSTAADKREQVPCQKGRSYLPKGSSRSGKQSLKITETPLAAVETATEKITKTSLADKTETQNGTKSGLPKKVSQKKTETKLFGEIAKMPAKPGSEKDVTLMMLTWREGALREKVGAWDEWAREKVMQATKRLGKDKEELRELREEREGFEGAWREREAIRDTVEKKMLETESYIRKKGAQIERVRVAARRLEGESGQLMRERDAARVAAEEAEERVREGVRREREREARGREWQREKDVIREEVAAEKRRGERLDKEAELVQDRRNRFEARLKNDQNAKDKLLKEANLVRNERKEVEASANKKKQMILENVEASIKIYNDDVQKLEKEISELRLKNDASIIAALRQGVKKLSPEEAHLRDLSKRTISNLDDDVEEIKRDRECAICLSEDRTVIFLPCAHQILCKECNEIHEKQGMKDCPSCRTVIQERICVRYASERR